MVRLAEQYMAEVFRRDENPIWLKFTDLFSQNHRPARRISNRKDLDAIAQALLDSMGA